MFLPDCHLCYFLADHLSLLLLIRFFTVPPLVLFHSHANGGHGHDSSPSQREGIGYFTLSTTVATAIGPFLGLFISQHADYQMIFQVCTLFSFISLLIAFFTDIPEVTVTKEQLQAMKSGFAFGISLKKKPFRFPCTWFSWESPIPVLFRLSMLTPSKWI